MSMKILWFKTLFAISLIPAVTQSCGDLATAISGEETASFDWTITIDSISDDGYCSECLTNQSSCCKTLASALKNIVTTNRSKSFMIKLNSASNHSIPSGLPPFINISLYLASEAEEEAMITCDNDNATRVWSIQHADFVVFKSLNFSNCNGRMEITNTANALFENVHFSGFTDSALRLVNNVNVTLQNTSFVNCSSTQHVGNYYPENSALSIVYRGSNQTESCIKVTRSQFFNNAVRVSKASQITSATAVTGENYPGRGGGLGIFINEAVNNTVYVIIDNCVFLNNIADAYGGAIYLILNGLSSGHSFTISNSRFDSNHAIVNGGGIAQGSYSKSGNFDDNTYFAPSHFNFINSSFTNNSAPVGGAVTFVVALARKRTSDMLSISGCIFNDNAVTGNGAAILISSLTYLNLAQKDTPFSITNCTFRNNSGPISVVGILFKDVDFYGDNYFISNNGPSIRAANSYIGIHGLVKLSHNTVQGYDGSLFLQDFSQIRLYKGAHIQFAHNYGIVSAAFTVLLQDYPRVFSQIINNLWCFVLYEDLLRPPSQWKHVNISFENNTAILAPNMYMSNFDLCSWQSTPNQKDVEFDYTEVLTWPLFSYRGLNITTQTTEGDIKGIRTSAVEISGTKNYTVRPGEIFTLDLVPYDSLNSTAAFVFGFVHLSENSNIASGRTSLRNDLSNQEDYENYVDVNPNIMEYLPGITSLDLSYGLPLKKPSLKDFIITVYSPVTVDVSDALITLINITVQKCSPGFALKKATVDSRGLTCECDYDYSILSCNEDGTIVVRDGLIASYRSNVTFPYIKLIPCPPTYCQCQKDSSSKLCIALYNYTNEEQQCHLDRKGVLCGGCKYDHDGVGVLSMRCYSCDDGSVSYLVMLVLLDIVLVILILFSATPFPPALRGILFYIQAMPFAVTSFPLSTWRGNQYMLFISSALSLYFPWDFCLYEGMTALASHFYVYIPSIIAVVIISIVLKYRPKGYTSPKGKRFQATYQKFRSKCAHGIWTITLLMFPRLSYNAWSIFYCLEVSNVGLRWYFDGNVQCYSDPAHMLLFLFGLVVVSFMTVLIVFIGLLTAGALNNITIKYATFKHICESASHGYKKKFKWWSFVDLGRRYVLLVFWVAFSTNSNLQIFIFFAIFLSYIYVQPYDKPWHNWLDSSLLACSIILLTLRSTYFVTDTLVSGAYTGVMLPYDNSSTMDSLPSDNAVTYFFVPLLYIPLLVALAIVSPPALISAKYAIINLYNYTWQWYQMYKDSNKDVTNIGPRNSSLQANTRHGSKVYVRYSDGRHTEVPVTYA